jgi:PAS domain S-box-containing protein
MRASERQLDFFLKHGSELVGLVDAAGGIRYLSPSFERILGYDPDSLIGCNILDYVHPDDIPGLSRRVKRILRSAGASATTKHRIRDSSGGWRTMATTLTNALDTEDVHGIVFTAHDVTERKLSEQHLLESRNQLRDLAAHVESAREEERIRIAREIHDQLSQLLSALKLDLEGLSIKYRAGKFAFGKQFTEEIAYLVANVQLTINTVRRISSELRPPVLDNLDLATALGSQIQEFETRTGIRCRSSGLHHNLVLGPEQSTAVFRIFHEILTNVARHAHASAVEISVETNSDWLTLHVVDTGTGMDPKHLMDPRSWGLVGMRERAMMLGGTVQFSQPPTGGTAVTLHIPTGRPKRKEAED